MPIHKAKLEATVHFVIPKVHDDDKLHASWLSGKYNLGITNKGAFYTEHNTPNTLLNDIKNIFQSKQEISDWEVLMLLPKLYIGCDGNNISDHDWREIVINLSKLFKMKVGCVELLVKNGVLFRIHFTSGDSIYGMHSAINLDGVR